MRELRAESFSKGHDFLRVQCGDLVAVEISKKKNTDWWAGHVLSRVGSSLDPGINTLFQIVDVDTGKVKIVNADLVKGIIKTND